MNDDSSSFTAIHVGDGEGKSRVFWRYPHRLPSSPGHVEMDLLFFFNAFLLFFSCTSSSCLQVCYFFDYSVHVLFSFVPRAFLSFYSAWDWNRYGVRRHVISNQQANHMDMYDFVCQSRNQA